MKFKIEEDGITHINIYSNGKTKLGQFLSNFKYAPIDLPEGDFNSIEAYWYYLGTDHPEKEILKLYSGSIAKNVGKRYKRTHSIHDDNFKIKIQNAISIKIESSPEYKKLLIQSELPFTHYYVYNNRQIQVTDCDWILEHITNVREQLKNGT